MRLGTTRMVAGLLIAAAACIAPAHGGPDCEPYDEDGWIPHEISFDGIVESRSGGQLVVSGTEVEIPEDPSILRLTDGTRDRDAVYYQPGLRVGDRVGVMGTFRRDASVLAWEVWDRSEEGPTPEAPVHAGICTAQGDGWFTAGGRTITLVPDPLYEDAVPDHPGLAFLPQGTQYWDLRDAWRGSAFEPVLVGDAVAVWTVEDGQGTTYAAGLQIRASGEGTSLAGTIRAVGTENDDIVVDGITVHLDEETCVSAPWDGASYLDFTGDDGTVGGWVRVDGVLRNGIVLANRIHAFAAGPAKREMPTRRGWIVMRGMVTGKQAGRLEVNALGALVRRESFRAVERLEVGARVEARGRLGREGPVIRSIRKR